jgi:dihydroneopterin aldolase
MGVYDWEKVVRQRLVLDLQLMMSRSVVARAAASDNVNDALDYVRVVERVRQIASEFSCQLIEAFAEGLADVLLNEFPLQKLVLSVQKPAALASVDSVGLVIERSR